MMFSPLTFIVGSTNKFMVGSTINVRGRSTISLLWGEQNLGPGSGVKYHILPTIRPRRGNYKGTS